MEQQILKDCDAVVGNVEDVTERVERNMEPDFTKLTENLQAMKRDLDTFTEQFKAANGVR